MVLSGIPSGAGATDIADKNSSVEEMRYYPFVYSENDDFAWAREIIGDCSECVPGYLYVQDLCSKEIWQVLHQPVSLYRSNNEQLYCIVGTTIVCTDYWGRNASTLYTAINGTLDNMEYYGGKLYFSDGNAVRCFDLREKTVNTLATCENITLLSPVSDHEFVWGNSTGDTYLYCINTGEEEPVDFKELLDAMYLEETNTNEGRAVLSLATPNTFPLNDYPSGSYFTYSGGACGVHSSETCSNTGGCNCKSYNASIQCVGFAKYAFDQYSHLYPRTGSWYGSTDIHSDVNRIALNTDADVWLLFNNLGYGAYMYLSRPTDTTGIHALITAGVTSTTVTIYEGNADGHCKVMLNTYTLANFRGLFDEVIKTVAHDFSGAATQATASYHRIYCQYDGCDGYIMKEHMADVPGKNATCALCGYVGAIYVQNPSPAG